MYSRRTLRPITIIRAVQWASIAVTAWSSAVPWGSELGIGKGPPSQYERQLMGAVLLLLLSALAMTFTARKQEKPGRFALCIATGASLGALALALTVRSTAIENHHVHVLVGGGWTWMAAGTCMSLGAAATAFFLTGLAKERSPQKTLPQKTRNKRQGQSK